MSRHLKFRLYFVTPVINVLTPTLTATLSYLTIYTCGQVHEDKCGLYCICPEPEAAKSPVLVDRQTHAHPNTASRRSLWWLTHSLSLTTPTPCTQLFDRVATCHFPLYTCGMYNISEQCLYNMAYMFSFFSSLDSMNK